jgi:hypothetical protein
MDFQIPEKLKQYLATEDRYHPLAFRVESPYYWKSSDLAQANILPIFECDISVTYFNRESGKFEERDLESAPSTVTQFDNFQQVLANLFIYLFEDECSLDDLRMCADICEFKHLERMLAEIAVEGGDDAWHDKFVRGCS